MTTTRSTVTNVERADTEERNVERLLEEEPILNRPKYLRRSIWAPLDSSPSFSPTAMSTLSDEPLPRPSPEEFNNSEAMSTIERNPHLFRIITPINTLRFEELLATHPNQPFVLSVYHFEKDSGPRLIPKRNLT